MGLDVSYFSKIKVREIGDEEKDYYYVENNNYFTYQLGSLKNGQSLDKNHDSEGGHFHAGSCSGYGIWRKHLLEMLGYVNIQDVFNDFDPNIRLMKLKEIETGEKIKIKPFYELICFSDCEGTIGPEVSKKLYEDFVEFDNISRMQFGDFYQTYSLFKEAFRVASDKGVVIFS